MDLSRIRELIKVATETDAAEVEIEEHGVRIIVRKQTPSVSLQPPLMLTNYGQPPLMQPPMPASPAPPTAEGPPPAESVEEKTSGVIVEAPTPGTFYSAPSPDATPFVSVGDAVQPGDTLCIIEAMKLMNEVDSEVGGVVKEVLVQDAEPVEFGQPLFVIDPASE